jgi:hypothetical protein
MSFHEAVSRAHSGPTPPPNVTCIEKRERGQQMSAGAGRRRRQRGMATESEDGNAIPNLLLKYSDATFTTYVLMHMKHLKYASETLAKTH